MAYNAYKQMDDLNKMILSDLFLQCVEDKYESRIVVEIENPKEVSKDRDYLYYMIDFSADGEPFKNDVKAVVSSSNGFWQECKSVDEAYKLICQKCDTFYRMYIDSF